MKIKATALITIAAFALTAGVIAVILFFPDLTGATEEDLPFRSRVINIEEAGGGEDKAGAEAEAEAAAAEEALRNGDAGPKAPLEEGEVLVTALSGDFGSGFQEEQFIAYRTPGRGAVINVAFIDFIESEGRYRRVWSAPAAAARPDTVSLYTQDLLGDRSLCVIFQGMNSEGEHILTAFRKAPEDEGAPEAGGAWTGASFTRVADIRIDGTIIVQETARPQAYQRGLTGGQPFAIAAYGKDAASANILDQIEFIYTYNPAAGRYERTKTTLIPGAQAEQRRVRELLSGKKGVFEGFISGLWYYVSPQGTLDSRQYIYFDSAEREVIFYGEEIQQVFTWVNSSPTRYGLYISAQNVSVTTLRRFLDIELESTDSIRVKVFEDVRLKIGVSAFWDGSYRKAAARPEEEAVSSVRPAVDAVYDSSIGRIRFSKTGVYEIASGSNVTRGRYVFFALGTQVMLELRASGEGAGAATGLGSDRATYRIEAAAPGAAGAAPQGAVFPPQAMTLVRVRLGASGVYGLQSEAISMTRAAE